MRLAVLGDIHGNLEALHTVLEDARRRGAERFVSVGDVVGYGADPLPCLDTLRTIGAGIVMGNHDQAVVGTLSCEGFNTYARRAVEWTAAALPPEALAFLKALPYTLREEGFAVSHGTFHQPEEFRYLLTEGEAWASLEALGAPVGFLGHTHLPVWARKTEDGQGLEISVAEPAPVDPGRPVVMNVGSVGQPRDGDPRTGYALYDTATRKAVLHRLPYDFEAAGRKILAAGLPEVLAERLKVGR